MEAGNSTTPAPSRPTLLRLRHPDFLEAFLADMQPSHELPPKEETYNTHSSHVWLSGLRGDVPITTPVPSSYVGIGLPHSVVEHRPALDQGDASVRGDKSAKPVAAEVLHLQPSNLSWRHSTPQEQPRIEVDFDKDRWLKEHAAESPDRLSAIDLSDSDGSMSMALHAQKNRMDAKELVSLKKSGYPDTVILQQVCDAEEEMLCAKAPRALQLGQDDMFARALRPEAEEEERIKQMQRIKQVSAAAAEQKRQEEEMTAKAAAAGDEEDAMFERALQAEEEQRIKMNRMRSESNVPHPFHDLNAQPCPQAQLTKHQAAAEAHAKADRAAAEKTVAETATTDAAGSVKIMTNAKELVSPKKSGYPDTVISQVCDAEEEMLCARALRTLQEGEDDMFARALRLEAEEEERIKQMQRIKQMSAAAAEQQRHEEEKVAKAAAAANQKTEQGQAAKQKQQVGSDAAAFLAQLKRLETQIDAAAIIQGMLTHSEHAGVQQGACRALWSLACNADNQVKIGAAGGIDAVLAAMRAHTDSGGVQEEACAALYNIAYNNKDNKGKIAETVVAEMKAHKGNALVHEWAFRALGSLADYTFNDDTEVKVAEAGGIAAVIGAMKAHKESATVQEWACRVLINLAASAENQLKIAEAGGIAAVLTAIKAHTRSGAVHEQACGVLCSLTHKNAANQLKIAAAGGIAAILAAMAAHQGDGCVQEEGCRALCNLAWNNADNQLKIAKAGGIEAILAAMAAHNATAVVQEHACAVLRNLALHADNKVKIAEAGGIEAAIAAMKAHTGSDGVQQYACGALRSLAVDAANQLKIANAGGIEAIVAAMKAHTPTAAVQQQACAALFNLAVNADNTVKIAAAGGIAAIVGAMQGHEHTAAVQEYACAALRNLAANNADNKSTIAGVGGIELLVAAMAAHEDSAAVQQCACWALSNLAAQPSLRHRIISAGGVERVQHAVSASNATASTHEWGTALLHKLARPSAEINQ